MKKTSKLTFLKKFSQKKFLTFSKISKGKKKFSIFSLENSEKKNY